MSDFELPQQLTLLPTNGVPDQFLIDPETRRRGMQHIAEIRQYLAQRQAARLGLEQAA